MADEAYRRTRKDGAPGVDGQSAAENAKDLEQNLASLRERFKSGRYQASAVRRVHIPKGDGNAPWPNGGRTASGSSLSDDSERMRSNPMSKTKAK